MPIKIAINQLSSPITIGSLPNNDKKLMAAGYGKIFKNPRSESVPLCEVKFIELDGNYTTQNEYSKPLPLTSLRHVRLGSIWYNTKLIGNRVFDFERFKVNFEKHGNEIDDKFTNYEILQAYHPELVAAGLNKSLEFSLPTASQDKYLTFLLKNDTKIFIPCIEFLVNAYAISLELMRVITTYNWNEVWRRLNFSRARIIDSTEWFIEIPREIRKEDASFLSHIRFNKYSQYQAKSVYSTLESDFSNSGFSFPYIKPWHEEAVSLEASGIWINKNSFVVHRLIGLSPPVNNLTRYDIEKTFASPNGATPGPKNANQNTTNLIPPKNLDITSHIDPSNFANTVELISDEFSLLGTPNTIREITDPSNKGNKILSSLDTPIEASGISTGEPYGTTKNILPAVTNTPVIEELNSEGILLDFWNALLNAQKRWPSRFISVEWFTFNDGFNTENIPRLIQLLPFKEKELETRFPKSTTWIYRNIAEAKLRGVMVLRCQLITKKAQLKIFYIVEIQRRLKKGKENNLKEEEFQGLIYQLESDLEHEKTLNNILHEVRYACGIMKKVPVIGALNIGTFSHSSSRKQAFPCESALINSFNKMGIKLPRF